MVETFNRFECLEEILLSSPIVEHEDHQENSSADRSTISGGRIENYWDIPSFLPEKVNRPSSNVSSYPINVHLHRHPTTCSSIDQNVADHPVEKQLKKDEKMPVRQSIPQYHCLNRHRSSNQCSSKLKEKRIESYLNLF